MRRALRFVLAPLVALALPPLAAACGGPPKPGPAAEASAPPSLVNAPDAATPTPSVGVPGPSIAATATAAKAPVLVDAGPQARDPAAAPRVKVENIGMHVAGGPFDEPTKVPFRKAVEPHYPEMALCWAKHVPNPPKSTDVGVDLLIEPGGGHPKVSNPRSNLAGAGPAVAAETKDFVPCLVKCFEDVAFAALDRGRTGVSYSLRFTTTK